MSTNQPTSPSTSSGGLEPSVAAERLVSIGPNTLPVVQRPWWRLLLSQFQSPLVLVLLGALVLSAVTPFFEVGELEASSFFDAFAIGLILLFNAVLGFVQETRAESAIAALEQLGARECRVRRGGVEQRVAAAAVVPGDLVVLEAGDRVVADGRLRSASHLAVDEASLTGESVPAQKSVEAEGDDGLLFSSTLVTRGEALLEVTATGMATRIGNIARMVGATEPPPTPLEKGLQRLSLQLGGITLILCVFALLIGFVRDSPWLETLMVAISLAVSAIPEGLPAVVTVCFAMGVQRMAGANALVRRLDALETLGAVTVICTDKTGTVTENRMRVVATKPAPGVSEKRLAEVLASSNHATLPDLGDPMELALLRHAESLGTPRVTIDEEVVPFSSVDKYMATRHGDQIFVKGAPEVLLEQAKTTDPDVEAWAGQGLRVLAAGVRQGDQVRYLGIVGLEDPPREGVADAVRDAASAGIRTLMITGDNGLTGSAIAARVGITGSMLTGADIDELDQAGLADAAGHVGVFARVTPEHKLRILHALQSRGEVVAMSGDGVNDAPALKGADVGIAMGERGTDVAREAAAIVLADDHFATIVTAIREGRRIHDNIRKFVLFLLRSNFDELLLVLAALAIGLPLPLLPLHILWINLLTDGFPALALGTEPAEPSIMARPPRPAGQSLLEGEGFRLGFAAVLGAGVALALWMGLIAQEAPLEHGRTVLLSYIVVVELAMAQSARSPRPLWKIGLLGNRWLLLASGVVMGLHAALVYGPLVGPVGLISLGVQDWGLVLLAAAFTVGVFELSKGNGTASARGVVQPRSSS